MSIEQTLKRIDREIASGDYGKARDRLHGLITTYPENLALRRKLGDVYWQLQYPAMAGRYWYLEEDKSPTMVVACQAFEHSCGKDPLQILLALKFRGDVESIRDTFAGRILLKLHAEARSKHRYYVDFRKRGAERYYHYRAEPIEEWKWRVLLAGCVVSLFIGLGLMVVGLLTVLTWVSGLIFGI